MEDKNRLLRLFILSAFFEMKDGKYNTIEDDYIREKFNFFLGNNLNEESLEKFKQFYKEGVFSAKSFNKLLDDIGDDEFYKIKCDSFMVSEVDNIIGKRIIGLHPIMSKAVLKLVNSYTKSPYFKQKFRELRLNRITSK